MDPEPTGVVVLGMHRSGTSVLAGILAEAGYFAGRDIDILPAARDNSSGFFERFDVIDLNNEMLAELGGAWDNPPPRPAASGVSASVTARIEGLLKGMAADAGGLPLVLKDPRMDLLLPMWMTALGDRFAVVLVSRNPLEVAMSMHKRDGQPVHVALALWQLYWAELLHGLDGQRVWFARYESLLQNPAQQTSLLLTGLNARLVGAGVGEGMTDGVEAASFVVGELHHHHVAPTSVDMEQALSDGQRALWQWLCRLPEGWVTLHPPSELVSQPDEALATAAEHHAKVSNRSPAPTLRGTLHLARHHYQEGGLARVASRATREALRLVRRR
jgi:hypothetical protein